MEQTYFVSGKRLSMRLWRNEEPQEKTSVRRAYETVGYVISGRAELEVEGQVVKLEQATPGSSRLVRSMCIGFSKSSPPWKPRLRRLRCTGEMLTKQAVVVVFNLGITSSIASGSPILRG
jgi:hypothetical protein